MPELGSAQSTTGVDRRRVMPLILRPGHRSLTAGIPRREIVLTIVKLGAVLAALIPSIYPIDRLMLYLTRSAFVGTWEQTTD